MKYLEEISFKRLEDFQVSYYLSRSRFMDIFKMKHDEENKFQPSGIAGQNNSSYRDTVKKTIKYYLPKVSRDVVDICSYERDSLRNEGIFAYVYFVCIITQYMRVCSFQTSTDVCLCT